MRVICDKCGITFSRKKSKVVRAKRHYCSRECVEPRLCAGGINIGEKNGMWRGGKTVTKKGYVKIICRDNPRSDRDGYVFEHIVEMEKKLGRFMREGEVVHHIDHNKMNNDINNLMLFESQSEHMRFERKKNE